MAFGFVHSRYGGDIHHGRAKKTGISFGSTPTTSTRTTTVLGLIPLSEFVCSHKNELLPTSQEETDEKQKCTISPDGRFQFSTADNNKYKSSENYVLCVVEPKDLPMVARSIVKFFGADKIDVKEFSDFEVALFIKPFEGFWNGLAAAMATAEFQWGLEQRLADRWERLGKLDHNQQHNIKAALAPPVVSQDMTTAETIAMANRNGILLVLAKEKQPHDNDDGPENPQLDVIASVELILQVSKELLLAQFVSYSIIDVESHLVYFLIRYFSFLRSCSFIGMLLCSHATAKFHSPCHGLMLWNGLLPLWWGIHLRLPEMMVNRCSFNLTCVLCVSMRHIGVDLWAASWYDVWNKS